MDNKLRIYDEWEWERVQAAEREASAREEAMAWAEAAITAVLPMAEGLTFGAGAAMCLAGVMLYHRNVVVAALALVASALARWTGRKIREEWRIYLTEEEEELECGTE